MQLTTQFVRDCLSDAGAVLLWGVAAIFACFFFEAAWNAVGWMMQSVSDALHSEGGKKFSRR
jgi:hypothetical protein